MNLTKMVARGRLEPVVKADPESPTGWMLVGWRRKANSRKHQEFTLRKPRPCTETGGKLE